MMGAQRPFQTRVLLVLIVFFGVQVGVFLLGRVGLLDQGWSKPLINGLFLVACIGLIRYLGLSASEIGLKLVTGQLIAHATICLLLFAVYVLFYVFAVRISSLRPVSLDTWWGILNYILVAFAEEIYYRGICFGIVRQRFSDRTAVFASTLLFGLAHANQGLGMLARLFTGWLWGSVRYSTDMIFLLIFPIHFAYNVVWLLFQGNWDHQPLWAQFFPLLELLLGILIFRLRGRLHAGRERAPIAGEG